MDNEELKKKIVSIVRGAMLEADELPFIETTDNIADALIAAGIGDVKRHRVFVSKDGKEVKQFYSGEEVENIVKERNELKVELRDKVDYIHEQDEVIKEYKHRAEVAERALKKFAENITCEDCPFFSDCASSEKMEDLIHSNYCFAEYLKQAGKELAEEGKDE